MEIGTMLKVILFTNCMIMILYLSNNLDSTSPNKFLVSEAGIKSVCEYTFLSFWATLKSSSLF